MPPWVWFHSPARRRYENDTAANTNDEELAGYRSGADQLWHMIDRHEADLLAERQQVQVDMRRWIISATSCITCMGTT